MMGYFGGICFLSGALMYKINRSSGLAKYLKNDLALLLSMPIVGGSMLSIAKIDGSKNRDQWALKIMAYFGFIASASVFGAALSYSYRAPLIFDFFIVNSVIMSTYAIVGYNAPSKKFLKKEGKYAICLGGIMGMLLHKILFPG